MYYLGESMKELLNISSIEVIAYFISFIAILFIILLITRAFWCWFLKTSEITRLLEEISEKISVNHNFQVDVENSAYEWRKAEWEQKYGKKDEGNKEIIFDTEKTS